MTEHFVVKGEDGEMIVWRQAPEDVNAGAFCLLQLVTAHAPAAVDDQAQVDGTLGRLAFQATASHQIDHDIDIGRDVRSNHWPVHMNSHAERII
jgi:hypothetical protein